MIMHFRNWARRVLFWFLEATSEIRLKAPNKKESDLILKLKNKIQKLDPLPLRSDSNSDWWLQSRQNLRTKIISNDPRRFLRWGVVIMNMYPALNRYLNLEYRYIRQKADYSSLWKKAILENGIGGGVRYPFNWKTSGSVIHSVYHLIKFNEFSGVNMSDIDVVIEFGGGYGRLCEAIYRTGFKGSYVIYDLPEFTALQEYYLSAQGFPVVDTITDLKDGDVYCTSEINSIGKLGFKKDKKTLFIATWSFSETPLNFRRQFETIIKNCDYLLIGYNEKIYPGLPDEVDNLEYFSALSDGMPEGKFENVPIVHMGAGNRYLFYMRR